MKRLISFLCILTLLCAFVVPLSSIHVSAAEKDDWFTTVSSAWKCLHGAKRNSAGEVQIVSGGSMEGRIIYKDKVTISFSYKAEVWSTSMGVQVHIVPYVRAGFYIREGYVSSMDTTQRLYIPNETGWHDYRFEIDYPNKIQYVYFDDEFVGTQELGGSSSSVAMVNFWVNYDGLAMVSDVHIDSNDATVAKDPNEMKLTQDYTEAFFQDWHEIDGWRVEPAPYATHYPEEGLISLTADPTEHQVYRSIERPLRPPTNYDMEFRAKRNYMGDDATPGHVKFLISTDNRHAWISFFTDRRVIVNNYGAGASDPHYDGPQEGLPFKVGYDWFTLRAEVRGEYITWFINDEMLVSSYKINTTPNNVWNVSIFIQNGTGLESEVVLDWVKYTPYFEDEIKIITPEGSSRFAEGSDIKLKAYTSTSAEKIDYYLNDVYVGSGYKKDNYVYTLKNAKVGTYSYVAKVGELETGDQRFSVVPALDCKISLDRDEMVVGETATATVTTGSIDDSVKAAKVEFYADGNIVSVDNEAPFVAEITKNQVGNSKIYAKVTDNKGKEIFTDSIELKVNGNGTADVVVGQEYEVDYDFAGKNGSLDITDGYYSLNVKHTKDGITYKTKDGEETYEGIGNGNFRIVVASGHAEFYWKDRYLVSVLLPYTPTYKSTIQNSGLSNVDIIATDAKSQVFYHKWNNDAEFDSGTLPIDMYCAVEFDKTDSSPEEIYFCDGAFSTVVSFREDGIYAKRDLAMTNGCDTEVKICDTVEPGCYRLDASVGLIYVTCNNKQLGQFRARLIGGEKKVTRKMTNPSASTYLAVKDNDDLYYFTEDFEENSEYSYDDYWMNKDEYYNTKTELVTTIKDEGNGNHYMNLSGSGVLLANGIDKNPSIKWKGRFSDGSGSMYVQFRRSFGDNRSRFGYDFAKKEWFFERRNDSNALVQSVREKAKTPPDAEKWHNFELVAEDFNVKLIVDGETAIEAQIPYAYANLRYGRFGIGVENGSFDFDDFEYIGKGRVIPGGYYTFDKEWGTWTTAGFFELEEGVVATYGSSGSAVTTDNGRSWTVSNPRVTASSFAVMPDGTWVTVSNDEQSMFARLSRDKGLTWEGPYRFAIGQSIGSASRLTCTMDGRLFMITNDPASTEYFSRMSLYYSDDGITWHRSEPAEFNTYNTGIIGNENIVVDTPRENEVWMYTRSDSGFVDYFISYDNGKTFDTTPHHSQLMQSAVCFRIVRDWDNPNTYYAVLGYDLETSMAEEINSPRNRSAIAVSYDGMETWEYAMDIMEGSEVPKIFTTDHMLNLVNGTLYTRQTQKDSTAGYVMGSLQTEKIKGIKRMPERHYRHFICYDVANTNGKDHAVLPKENGSAWIFGSRANVTVKDGRYDIATIENVFGVTAVKSGTTVNLTLGDGKVTLTEGSTSYDVNGTAGTAERAVLVDGFIDIKEVAKIFGRVINETEDSYSVLYKGPSVEQFQKTIDNLA